MKQPPAGPEKLRSTGLLITAAGFLLMVTQSVWASFVADSLRGPLVLAAVMVALFGLILVFMGDRAKRRNAPKKPRS